MCSFLDKCTSGVLVKSLSNPIDSGGYGRHAVPVQSNAEYENWVKKFYEGSFLIGGWDSVKSVLLRKLPSDSREKFEEEIDRLGKKIGGEWARDNDVRKIDTDDLRRWSDSLKACDSSPMEMKNMLQNISHEVENKLAG